MSSARLVYRLGMWYNALMMTEFEKQYLDARKELILSDFSSLNPMQQEAVLKTEGPLLILAGAGSGKTTVLINRIAKLLKYGRAGDCEEIPEDADEKQLALLRQGGDEAKALAAWDRVEPWRILAITFTNKAAGELKARLESMLGEAAQDIWACTFHSACVRILRRDAERLGYTGSFTIYDTSDSLSLLKHIIKDMDLDEKTYAPRTILSEMGRAKDDGVSPTEYLQQAGMASDLRRRKIGEVYAEYARRCFAANAMDFDDLVYNTVKLLEENADVLEHWQRRFRYVLIDEYQDTNRLQYRLSSLLEGLPRHKTRAELPQYLPHPGRGQCRHRPQHPAQGQGTLDEQGRRRAPDPLFCRRRAGRGPVCRLADHERLRTRLQLA